MQVNLMPVVLGSRREQLADVLYALRLTQQEEAFIEAYDQRRSLSMAGVDLCRKPDGSWALVLADTDYRDPAQVVELLRNSRYEKVIAFDDFNTDGTWR